MFIKVLIPNMMNTLVRGGKYQNSVLHKIRQSQPCYKSARHLFYCNVKVFPKQAKKEGINANRGCASSPQYP